VPEYCTVGNAEIITKTKPLVLIKPIEAVEELT